MKWGGDKSRRLIYWHAAGTQGTTQPAPSQSLSPAAGRRDYGEHDHGNHRGTPDSATYYGALPCRRELLPLARPMSRRSGMSVGFPRCGISYKLPAWP